MSLFIFGGAAAKLMMEARPATRPALHAQARHGPNDAAAAKTPNEVQPGSEAGASRSNLALTR